MLSETYNSTSGRVLANHFDEEVAEIVRSFEGPVYHVGVIVYTDMAYDSSYGQRVPYVDSYDVSIWSYTDKPVLYKYVVPGSYWGECSSVDKKQHPNPKAVNESMYNRIAALNQKS